MANQISTTELSVGEFNVNVIPAQLSANFADLEARLDTLLDKDRVVVTLENLAEQKKRNANLNKLAIEVKTKINDVVASASIHIDQFKGDGKRLVDKILAVRTEADQQVKAFEQVTKDKIDALVIAEARRQWALQNVGAEYKKTQVSDLVKLTAITSNGGLTKATLTEIENRVKLDKAQQTSIENRLMNLENQCLKADINPPLSRASVEAFLFADDFDSRLSTLIAAEIARKAEQESRMREKLDAEKQRDIDAALAQQKAEIEASQRQEAKNYVQPVLAEIAKESAVIADSDAIVPFTVTISKTYVYEIQTKKSTSIDKIKQHYLAKHNDPSGDWIVNVEVVRHEAEVVV